MSSEASVATAARSEEIQQARERYVARGVATTPLVVARAEGAVALQGFWHLSSLAAPPPPAEFSDARLKELTARVWGGRTYDELAGIGGFLIGAQREFCRTWPNQDIVTIEGSHFLQEEAPEAMAQAIARFVAKVLASPPLSN